MPSWHMIGISNIMLLTSHAEHPAMCPERICRESLFCERCQAVHRFLDMRADKLCRGRSHLTDNTGSGRKLHYSQHTANRPYKMGRLCALNLNSQSTGWVSFSNLNFESHTNKETGTSHDRNSRSSCGTPLLRRAFVTRNPLFNRLFEARGLQIDSKFDLILFRFSLLREIRRRFFRSTTFNYPSGLTGFAQNRYW